MNGPAAPVPRPETEDGRGSSDRNGLGISLIMNKNAPETAGQETGC